MTLMLLALTLFSLPPEGADLFEKANNAYHEGNYDEAIAGYTALQDQFDVESAALYFNLGNAWQKKGNLGNAVLNYEIALAIDQHFDPARTNLETCLKATKRNLPPPDPRQLDRMGLFRHYPFTPMQSLLFTHAFLLLTLALYIVRYWKETPRLLWFTRIAPVIALIFFAFTVAGNYASKDSPILAVTLFEEAPVYFSMNDMDSPRFLLYQGDRVLIDRFEDGWVRVNTYSGERGWMKKDHAGFVELGIKK